MKKFYKFISSILLFSILLTTNVSNVFAVEQSNMSSQVEMTDEIAIEMATNFAKDIEPEKQISAKNPIKFYDSNGQAIGYIVHYYQGEIPYGYVVIDTTYGVPISEFSIGENAISPYERMEEKKQRSGFYAVTDTEMLICTEPYTYALVNEYGTGIDMYGGEYTNGDAQLFSSSKPGWNDCFIEIQDLYENYTPTEKGFLSKAVTLTETEAILYSGRYACAVSALAICAMYYNIISKDDLFTEYNKIWDDTNTKFTSGSDTYGSTVTADIGPGFAKYCKSKGASVSYSLKTLNVYNELKKNVERNQISVVRGTVGGTGHAMAVEGYTVIKAKNTGKTLNTLIVADGWYDTLTYLNYDHSSISNKQAICFSK